MANMPKEMRQPIDALFEHREACYKAQLAFCEAQKVPFFVPPSGVCYACRQNVYDRHTIGGAGTHLITGCPFCHKSFVD